MSTGLHKPYTSVLELTSGATLTSSANLGRTYRRVYLEVPTMASGDLYIHASIDGTNFKRVTEADPNQGTDFIIASAVTNRIVPIPAGFQYYKIENSSGATDTTTVFNIVGSD